MVHMKATPTALLALLPPPASCSTSFLSDVFCTNMKIYAIYQSSSNHGLHHYMYGRVHMKAVPACPPPPTSLLLHQLSIRCVLNKHEKYMQFINHLLIEIHVYGTHEGCQVPMLRFLPSSSPTLPPAPPQT
jgi:hypothetical protein